ncbi:MAG: hypothetical protein IKH04_06410 [Kiritimatiellae bacterium]|nr:hypothetical protein [Kiritimatiellia bacterium]
MLSNKRAFATAIAAATMAIAVTGDAFAQARMGGAAASAATAKASGVVLKVRQLTKPGNSCLVPSPRFDGGVKGPSRSSGTRKRWAALEVEYTTMPDWIDSATFTFHVMSVDDEKTFHYYTTSVTYLDIAKGDHGACVMLAPSTVLRYGTPVAFGVEIEIDGKQVALESEGQGKGSPWWTRLDGGKMKVERHAGYLLDRSKTPFGLTHIDEYEAVR